NAVILVDNYQRKEVQEIADFLGDSLALSQAAAKTHQEIIVFCGVHFMAETAKILSPGKLVLLPDLASGCPMADMIDEEKLLEYKKKYPHAKVVCYINSSAKVKALSDICCTSRNALEIVSNIKEEILFIPDQSLGNFISRKISKKIYLYPGFCPTHHRLLIEDLLKAKEKYPRALVVVHPECTSDIIDQADYIGGTEGIAKFIKNSNSDEFIIGTEIGMLERLKKENPQKKFFIATERLICPNMKQITLEKVLESLEKLIYPINVPRKIAKKAYLSLERMFSFKLKEY
ncbi:MAG: quinolinate synthase NadA, partial [Armatimonadetes bacterium]|nr:quinolinate synthase NadA [Armatimonadota bacterium]